MKRGTFTIGTTPDHAFRAAFVAEFGDDGSHYRIVPNSADGEVIARVAGGDFIGRDLSCDELWTLVEGLHEFWSYESGDDEEMDERALSLRSSILATLGVEEI